MIWFYFKFLIKSFFFKYYTLMFFEKLPVIMDFDCPDLSLLKKGKVRSVYDFGDVLLIAASDRVSSFDRVLKTGISGKGEILTKIATFWFKKVEHIFPTHFISSNWDDFPSEVYPYKDQLFGRSMLVKKTEPVLIEAVVRGYLVGSGWQDYKDTGKLCGIDLPKGLRLASRFDSPLFTPSTKANAGDRDENITYEAMQKFLGGKLANQIRDKSLEIFNYGSELASKVGFILADSKFEFGILDSELILIDEILTPDSSRFWDVEDYQIGVNPPSFDKQIVRDYVKSLNMNQDEGLFLSDDVVEHTYLRYRSVLERFRVI